MSHPELEHTQCSQPDQCSHIDQYCQTVQCRQTVHCRQINQLSVRLIGLWSKCCSDMQTMLRLFSRWIAAQDALG